MMHSTALAVLWLFASLRYATLQTYLVMHSIAPGCITEPANILAGLLQLKPACSCMRGHA